jgi:hypothetical protein
MGAGKVFTGFWWGDMSERDYMKDLGVDGEKYLNGFTRTGLETWIGLD